MLSAQPCSTPSPTQPTGGSSPTRGSPGTACGGSPQPTHVTDISGTLDAAVASLAAHRTYLEALGTDARAVLDTVTGGRPEVTFEVFGG